MSNNDNDGGYTKNYLDIKILEAPEGNDDPFNGRVIPICRNVMARLIQEEIWAQTLWPEDEFSLEEILFLNPNLFKRVT
jgi:hypothetical protein